MEVRIIDGDIQPAMRYQSPFQIDEHLSMVSGRIDVKIGYSAHGWLTLQVLNLCGLVDRE